MKTVVSLSVIIPVYNVEKYLPDCLDSVLAQQIPIEVIIINDGSTDNSGIIAENYKERFPDVQVIHKRNRGLSAARNHGLRIAHGQYIAFIDSDDTIISGSLPALYQLAIENKADIVRGNSKIQEIVSGRKCFTLLHQYREYVPTVWSSIYKREFLLSKSLFFEHVIHEDELWTPTVLLHAEKVVITDINYYQYQQHRTGSIMQTLNVEKRILSLIKIANRLFLLYNTHKEITGKDISFTHAYLSNICRIYFIAFESLAKVKKHSFILPVHSFYQLYTILKTNGIFQSSLFSEYTNYFKKHLKKYLLYRRFPLFTSKSFSEETTKKLILLYNPDGIEKSFCYLHKKYPSLHFTSNHDYLPYAKIIIFYLSTLAEELYGELIKPDHQIWIAFNPDSEADNPLLKNKTVMDVFDHCIHSLTDYDLLATLLSD